MFKLSFLNVKQGDSIVFEYRNDESKNSYDKIGIIDCNTDGVLNSKNKPINRIIEFLKDSTYKEIDFFILTHPHYDHYSGFEELLQYCILNKIIINSFLHSCSSIPQYLKAVPKSNISANKLQSLFKLIQQCLGNGIIKKQTFVNNDTRVHSLTNSIGMNFFSPSWKETDNFTKNVPLFKDEENYYDKPQANWLSIVTKFFNVSNGNFILLTSDSERFTLKRIRDEIKVLNNKDVKLILGQCPHHGASGNLHEFLWKHINRNSRTPCVISVGENIYKHPNQNVLDFFRKENYLVLLTDTPKNSVIKENTQTLEDAIINLGYITHEIDSLNDLKQCDKVFEFDFDLNLIT